MFFFVTSCDVTRSSWIGLFQSIFLSRPWIIYAPFIFGLISPPSPLSYFRIQFIFFLHLILFHAITANRFIADRYSFSFIHNSFNETERESIRERMMAFVVAQHQYTREEKNLWRSLQNLTFFFFDRKIKLEKERVTQNRNFFSVAEAEKCLAIRSANARTYTFYLSLNIPPFSRHNWIISWNSVARIFFSFFSSAH